jgi:hypothetical protein
MILQLTPMCLHAQHSAAVTDNRIADDYTTSGANAGNEANTFTGNDLTKYNEHPLIVSGNGYYLILSIKNDLILRFNSKGELVNSSRKTLDRVLDGSSKFINPGSNVPADPMLLPGEAKPTQQFAPEILSDKKAQLRKQISKNSRKANRTFRSTHKSITD